MKLDMNSCKIVMYHYVRPIKKSKYPEIKGLELDGFKKQIEYFQNHFKFITSEDLLDCIYSNKQIPKNSVLLTFDDGFKDHYSYVFPILKKLNIQGSFFLSGKIFEEYLLDVHKIHFILANNSDKSEVAKDLCRLIDENQKEYNLKSTKTYFEILVNDNRYDTKEVNFIKTTLQRSLPRKLKNTIVAKLFKKYVTDDERSFSKELYMSIDEIREMKEQGMYFGSHAYSHEWLPYLLEDELKDEMAKSLQFYTKINGESNDWIISYPYGASTKEVVKILKKQGFKAGINTVPRDALLTESNAFSLERYDTNDFPQ